MDILSLSSDDVSPPDGASTGSDVILTSFPVVCTFAVAKMASRENSSVSERSLADIKRKHAFKVSQIMELLNWAMKWSVHDETGEISEGVFTTAKVKTTGNDGMEAL